MQDVVNVDKLSIGIASPEHERECTRDDEKKPETIKYRTLKP